MMQIAVLGLGNIGMGVAKNLQKNHFDVLGLDISAERLQMFADCKGKVSDNLAQTISNIDVLLVCLVSSEQIKRIFSEQILDSTKNGTIIVVMSTVSASFIEAFAAKCARYGVSVVDAPVSGGQVGAENGTLSIFTAAEAEILSAVQNIFEAIGKKIYKLGPKVGMGSTYKIVHQLLAGVHIAAAAEAMALAEKSGLDLDLFYDIVSSSAGQSWMFGDRGKRMIQKDYASKSDVNIFVKDLGLVQELAQKFSIPSVLTNAALEKYLEAQQAGYGNRDDSSVLESYLGDEEHNRYGKYSAE